MSARSHPITIYDKTTNIYLLVTFRTDKHRKEKLDGTKKTEEKGTEEADKSDMLDLTGPGPILNQSNKLF